MIRARGSPITIDLEASASPANPIEATSQPRRISGARSCALRYARSMRTKNNPDVRSRRSVIQATDSTRSGCTEKKSAAAPAPRPRASWDAEGIARPSRRRATR